MDMKKLVAFITEALESAGVPEDQRRQVLIFFVLAWGNDLQRDLDKAEVAGIAKASAIEA
jgi:hypothetical protein